jgi:hypothetical protein
MKNMQRVATWIYLGIYFGLPIWFSLISVGFISRYMSYYRIGINASANNWALLFFDLPLLLSGSLGTVLVIWHLTKGWGRWRWKVRLLGLFAAIGFCVIFVRWNIAGYADYPSYKAQNFDEFLDYYIHNVLLGHD